MTLADGYADLPPAKIASVVTYLEMRERPRTVPAEAPPGIAFRKVLSPDLNWYRALYRAIGQDWLWFSRLRMNDTELARTLHDPQVDLYALSIEGEDKGLLELDLRIKPDVEIATFGLTPDLTGRGVGQYLMGQALAAAWSHSPQRVWLHTCTLDHPRALSFYLEAGFVPYKRAIEVADDPRISGDIPKDAAPAVPVIPVIKEK
jgi:GNAT superfamily N-acetyltransferase